MNLASTFRHLVPAKGRIEQEMPLVSIIMPAYNAAATLKASIASVQSQTYPCWQLLVINDASTDATAAIAGNLAATDPRITLVNLPGNRGPVEARNIGLDAAKGRFIAFLDADDVWYPTKLHWQVETLQNTSAALCCTSYELMDNNGKLLHKYRHVQARHYNYQDILANNVIGCLTLMVDVSKTGPFQIPHVKTVAEDYACWLKLLRNGVTAVGIPEVLAVYRFTGNSRSSDKFHAAKGVWNVLRHNEKLPLTKALWYFGHYAILRSPRLFERRAA